MGVTVAQNTLRSEDTYCNECFYHYDCFVICPKQPVDYVQSHLILVIEDFGPG